MSREQAIRYSSRRPSPGWSSHCATFGKGDGFSMPADSLPLIQVPTPAHLAPRVYLENLDHLWFQLTGTLCNLTCTHCFISCSPGNHSFEFLDYETVIRTLEESTKLGVKE